MKTVVVENTYPFAAGRVWALATDYEALEEVMAGIAAFEGLPEGRAETGQELEVMVSLFGKLPAQPYHMRIVECDDQAMVMRSSERGAGVKSWHHKMEVNATPEGCVLRDTIEIDAGLMTWAFAKWARYLYGARHKPRLRLLEAGRF